MPNKDRATNPPLEKPGDEGQALAYVLRYSAIDKETAIG